MTPPADIVCFAKVRLRDGTQVKAMVTPGEKAPVSRETAMQMILAASLLLEEVDWACRIPKRIGRRLRLLRDRMDEAIEREDAAKAVIASRPVVPTVEDAE